MSSESNDARMDDTARMIEELARHPHPKTFEMATLVVIVITGILGAIIGMELMVALGITANTSIIGALVAVLIGLVPVKGLQKFRSIHRQNIIETSISVATFAAGNMMLFALAIAWLMDKSLIVPMAIGGGIAILLDVLMMYWMFDTPTFPARGTWGPGVATSETILSAAQGGKRAILMLVSGIVGAVGQAFKIPMDVFGVCFLGNPWALFMFGTGLLLRAYSTQIFGFDLAARYIPHGIMIGAGMVAIGQVIAAVSRKRGSGDAKPAQGRKAGLLARLADNEDVETFKTTREERRVLLSGSLLYILATVFLAVISGLYLEMSTSELVLWVLYTALTTVAAELLIGNAAMNAGWFPSSAIAMLFVIIGLLLGFDAKALIFLAGFKTCGGPAFADMGYDLKTGWILRGEGRHKEFELEGRRQQLYAEIIGLLIGIAMAVLLYANYFMKDLIPPIARVFATTIEAGSNPEIIRALLTWSVAGAVIQFIGGPHRQMGVLFGTGLLMINTTGGFAVYAALAIRWILHKIYKGKEDNILYITAAGFIAGASLFSFFKGTLGAFVTKK